MKKIALCALSLAVAVSLNAVVLATVDGEAITEKDILPLIGNMPGLDLASLPDDTKRQILDRAIDIKLLTKEAYKNGIEEDEFYKNQVQVAKDALAVRVYQLKKVQELEINDEDVLKFYNKSKDKFVEPAAVSASHILVANIEAAQGIIKDLKKVSEAELPTAFASKASELSIDTSAAQSGGNLGWFAPEQMVKEFSDALAKLKTGEMTQTPVKTQFGYHIILKTGDRAKKQLTFEEVKPYIIDSLKQEKAVELADKNTKELRKKAKIEYK
ncbi:MAG: peptidylprolyl isomerase [Campylobacter sp.]|nr:peptidylprolyl isomerase [Campylobacter sp.]